jgi:hypothetical protein
MPAGTSPFIAVDSLASIVAGRANRALPKTLARFDLHASGQLPQLPRFPRPDGHPGS